MHARRILILIQLFALGLSVSRADDKPDSLSREESDFFEARIRPVLVRHCYECHSSESMKIKGGLRLDHRAGLVAGGETGPAVVPGNIEGSLLVDALRYEGLEMPPSG
ncbi:MAG: c-type cytochrome domain-containing protein, partial [bacterium]